MVLWSLSKIDITKECGSTFTFFVYPCQKDSSYTIVNHKENDCFSWQKKSSSLIPMSQVPTIFASHFLQPHQGWHYLTVTENYSFRWHSGLFDFCHEGVKMSSRFLITSKVRHWPLHPGVFLTRRKTLVLFFLHPKWDKTQFLGLQIEWS